MVNWDGVSWSQKVREEIFLFYWQKSCVEKGYTKLVKRLPQMCTTVQLWVERERGVFVVRLLGGRVGREKIQDGGPCVFPLPLQTFQLGVKHFTARLRQTFRLGFVKHFGSSSNISARRSEMLGIIWRWCRRRRQRTFSKQFKCSVFYEYPNCLSFILLLETGFRF